MFYPPCPPIASQSITRDEPLAPAKAFQFAKLLFKRVAKAALYCAHRTSTVSPCAFCEQEGHLAAPSPSFSGRALREHRRSSPSIPSHPLSRRDVLLAQTRVFRFLTFPRGSRQTILQCAHRAITVLSWGLCEQEGWLPVPSPRHPSPRHLQFSPPTRKLVTSRSSLA
jgi:hypothetical protein